MMFFIFSWDKEKIVSPHEESKLRPSDAALCCSTTDPQRLCGERGPVQSSYMTHILHTARIGNVNGVMFVNRISKMGSFELDKEIEKDFFFVLSLAWDKEKILNPHEELNLRPSDSALLCSTTDPQRLYG